MVFLNPSILIGLLAATIPVIIHILNFRKLKKVEFSSLAFLKELQKSKIKKIKIKQWLLLILRTLIIIFLVLSFARPTLESTLFGSATSTAKSSVAFLIDNSFSMSLVRNNGSLFNKSKTEAKKIINKMRNEDEFYFIISKDSVLHFADKSSAEKFLRQFKLSFVTENLSLKINTAISVLTKTHNINKELYLFSDFQKSTFTDSTSKKIKSKNIKLYSFDVGYKDASNYSVKNLKLESAIPELNKPLTFSAIVMNHSQNSVKITASLFINTKRVAQQSVSLKANGKNKVMFNTTLKNDGLIDAKVKLEDDNIIQDNTNYFTFYVPKKIKILLLYENPANINFLKAVFGSALLKNKFKITSLNITKNSNIIFPDYDVIFLAGIKKSVLTKLKKSVAAGKNLVIIPSKNITKQNLQLLSKELKYPITERIIQTDKNKNDYLEFDYINFNHPVFQNLFQTKRKKAIESPLILKALKLKNNYNITSIITLNNGTVFLGEYKFGKGEIMFYNIAMDLQWSNFPVKAIFAPLFTKIVYYLSSQNLAYNKYYTGESINIETKKIKFPILSIILPDGNDNINLGNYKNKIYKYKSTFLPGSYKFYSNKKLITFANVNINPKESDLTKLGAETKDNFFKKYFSGNFLNVNINENYLEKIKQSRYGTELWKPFLIVAFLLALIEMFIARNTKKDLINLKEK